MRAGLLWMLVAYLLCLLAALALVINGAAQAAPVYRSNSRSSSAPSAAPHTASTPQLA